MQQDVASHAISMARINQAVSRILTLKFQLGLFDHPLVERRARPTPPPESGRSATLRPRASR